MGYSVQKRVEIMEIYFINSQCANRVAELFNQRHPDKLTGAIVSELLTDYWGSIIETYCNG